MESPVIRAENSVARQSLEGDAMAPGTQATLGKLQDKCATQALQLREALPEIFGFPTADTVPFGRSTVREKVAFSPQSGRWEALEHLRPLFDEGQAMQHLFKLGENLASAHVPQVAVSMVRSGRLTFL